MSEMLNKKDVLDAIEKKMKIVNEADGDADVVLGLAAAMSTVKQMQAAPVNFAEKQEPCTDAISRQAAIYVINHAQVNFSVESEIDFTKHEREVHEIIENVLGTQEKALKQLPPVKPAEKVGQWEWNQYDSNPKIGNWHCSQCHGIGKSYYDYCPYCKAKMLASPTGTERSE